MNNNPADISAIVLTYNEELHIRRCLENVLQLTDQIFVIDSFSTDKTVAIAEEMGGTVLQHKWENNYAKQFNWGMSNCPIKTTWVLRLDADEYLLQETIQELKTVLPRLDDEVSGIIIKRRHFFFNKWMKKGTYPIKLLRVFKNGLGKCEQRLMDEHIILSCGKTIELKNDFVDHNLNDLLWWSHKHNNYAVREAIDLLDIELNILGNAVDDSNKEIGLQASNKRKTKHLYCRLPLFWRAFAYFFYRYFLRLGFLEGREGFCWLFFQGLWYRMLVDATIFEIKKKCGNNPEKIRDYIATHYHIALK